MARQERDLTTPTEIRETPIYTSDRADRANYKEKAAATDTKSLLQDISWFIPVLLLAGLGYILYTSYFATPVVDLNPGTSTIAKTTAPTVTTPATVTATPVTPAATTVKA
jgi:hypothetical protein